MTEPVYQDRVTISCTFGDDEKCKQIMIYLNYDEITAEDIARCVEAAFNASMVTVRNLGGGGMRMPRRFWNNLDENTNYSEPPKHWFGQE